MIRLQGNADEPSYTVIEDERLDQGMVCAPLRAHDLRALASGKSVQVLVPTTDVLLTRVQLPKASASRLAKAIPYALEEWVAEDVEALHFAFTVERDGIAVAVVARSTLDTWLQHLRSAGIEPKALIPDVLAIARVPNTWSMLTEERTALVRTGEHAGFSTELEALHGSLDAALLEAKQQPPVQLHLYDVTDQWSEERLAQGLSMTPPPITYKRVELKDEPSTSPFKAEHLASGLNLLQGTYAPRGDAKHRWSPWRFSAALVVLLLIALAANEVNERGELRAATEQIDARLEALFRNTFPETRRIVNPMAQMKQELRALRVRRSSARGDFLQLLAEVGVSLKTLGGIRLESLDYQNGRLDVDLIVRDVQALDELKRTLRSQPKLITDILSATAGDNGVRSRIRIEHSRS